MVIRDSLNCAFIETVKIPWELIDGCVYNKYPFVLVYLQIVQGNVVWNILKRILQFTSDFVQTYACVGSMQDTVSGNTYVKVVRYTSLTTYQ